MTTIDHPAAVVDETYESWLHQRTNAEQDLRERVIALLSEPRFAPREGLTHAEQAALSYTRLRELREHFDVRVSEIDSDRTKFATIIELAATIDSTLCTLLSIHFALCCGTIVRHGTPALDPYLAELEQLDAIGTYLVTEVGYGNNVQSLRTRADYDETTGDLVLNTPGPEARKFMPNTAFNGTPKIGIVMARLFTHGTDRGVFPLVVRLSTSDGPCEGVRIMPLGEKPSYSLDNAMTEFHDVRVPRECLLLGNTATLDAAGHFTTTIISKRERFLATMSQVDLGRVSLSSACTSFLASAATIAIRYGAQRQTFASRGHTVPILDYRNHHRDVFSALAYAYALRVLLTSVHHHTDAAIDAGEPTYFRLTSTLKILASYSAEKYIRLCRERSGAAGLFEANRMVSFLPLCAGVITAEGDNHIIMLKLARNMSLSQGYSPLTESPLDLVQPLTSTGRLVSLIRERERRLLVEFQTAMLPALGADDPFDLWNVNSTLALDVAYAHSTRSGTEAFAARLGELADDDPRVDLFRLFALTEIAPHLAYYLVEGLITTDEVRQFRSTLDEVCAAIRPSAIPLVDGLGMPNTVLRAPIAEPDYITAYANYQPR